MEEIGQFTFTFANADERQFKRVLNQLGPDEYTVVEDIHMVKPDLGRASDLKAVYKMDPETALMFRLSMKNVNIKQQRSEEEEAARKALIDSNKIKISVKVAGLPPAP